LITSCIIDILLKLFETIIFKSQIDCRLPDHFEKVMKLLHIVIISAALVLVAHVYISLKGPDYSRSSAGVPSWPLFKVAIRISDFLRVAFLTGKSGPLLAAHHGFIHTASMRYYMSNHSNVINHFFIKLNITISYIAVFSIVYM